jgi:hypothetical protein
MNLEIALSAKICIPVKTAGLPCQLQEHLPWMYGRSNRTNKGVRYIEPAHYTEDEPIIPESIASRVALALQSEYTRVNSGQGKGGNFAFIPPVKSDQVNP